MHWMNYHHLHYFWMVAKAGSIRGASPHLHLTEPTISTQIRRLESSLQQKLFRRVGRNLVLTETGRMVFEYADRMFRISDELRAALDQPSHERPMRLSVGAQDTVPKLIVYRFLAPVFTLPHPIRMVCVEGTAQQLLPRLSVHDVDLVLSDAPLSPMIRVQAYNHFLGDSGIAWFGAPGLARGLRKSFPASLNEAPLLLPAESTAMRWTLESWFQAENIRPHVVAEFEDIELMMTIGREGHGLFPAHQIIADEIILAGGVTLVGKVKNRSERFYLISVERQLKHPAVAVLTQAAREHLFHRQVTRQRKS